MTIHFYTQSDENEVISLTNYSKDTVIGHLIEWTKIYKKVFNYKEFSLIARNEANEICGYFPLFLVKNILQKKYLISTPFTNFSGIIYSSDENIYLAFIKRAKELAIQEKVEYVEIRQLNENKISLPERSNFVSMFLELNNDINFIWKKKLNTKVRNQVRKAEKNKLQIIENDSLENFYSVYCQNMRDLGSPSFPLSFFKEIRKQMKEKSEILSVKYGNKTIASMFIVKWGKYFSDPWASSIRKYNFLNPNNLLYWNAIKKACSEGYEIFDMGRSTINTGTYHFKKQWGSLPVPLSYQYIFNKTNKIPIVDAKNNKYELAIKIWKNLPLSIANFIGNRIIKFLPEL